MRKLSALPSGVRALQTKLGYVQGDGRAESSARSPRKDWRAWYKKARWQELRLKTFLRDRYTCQMCGLVEGNASKLVCDHIRPHRGNEALFWAPDNLQTLCKSPCHDKHKQAQEQQYPTGIWD